MSSWRETTSQQAQDDLDRLLGAILPFAEGKLRDEGGFHPFGVMIDDKGEPVIVSSDPKLNLEPKADEILAALVHEAKESADKSRAVAFVTDVFADGANAIKIDLEHREGVAVMVLRAYEMQEGEGSEPSFGELTAFEDSPQIWNTGE